MEDYNDLVSDNSFNEETYYSDQIDSDIEAELYGLIHHDVQDNSLLDKSDSVENKSVSLHNKSTFTENNSVLLQNSIGPTVDNSVSLQPNSIPSKHIVKSTKKKKKSIRKNNQNGPTPVKTTFQNLFSSDIIANNNLYTSFECPVQKQKIQSNQMVSENSKRNMADKPAKRKSDEVSEILENIQVKKNIKSKQPESSVSVRKKTKQNLNFIMSEENSFLEVIDDSSNSDSDNSIIFLEPDPSNIQTNITKETVTLSSDAEDSDSSMERSFSEACQRKQTAIAKLNISSNNTDSWHINSEDQFRRKNQSNRYHINAVVTCSNCQLKGHNAKFCSVPKAMKCFFCGNYHSGMNCKNKICTRCFNQGHDRRRCYRRIDTCELCRLRGHSEKNCPDIWRRYHLTTSKGTIVKGNPNPHSPLYCYNCGLRGHYGAECMENRTDKWSFPTWTSVVSYKNPITSLQSGGEIRNHQERSKFDRTPLFNGRKGNETLQNNLPSYLQSRKKKKKKKSPRTPPISNHQPIGWPNNTVQKEVYFPRTPKGIPTSSTVRLSKKKSRKSKKEDSLLRQQVLHRISLQERLGLPFPSTV